MERSLYRNKFKSLPSGYNKRKVGEDHIKGESDAFQGNNKSIQNYFDATIFHLQEKNRKKPQNNRGLLEDDQPQRPLDLPSQKYIKRSQLNIHRKNNPKKTRIKNGRFSIEDYMQNSKRLQKKNCLFPSQTHIKNSKRFFLLSKMNSEEQIAEICRILKDNQEESRSLYKKKHATFVESQMQKLQGFATKDNKKKMPSLIAFDYNGSLLQIQPPKIEGRSTVEMGVAQVSQGKIELMTELQQSRVISKDCLLNEQHYHKIQQYISPYLSNFQKIKWNDKITEYRDSQQMPIKQKQKNFKSSYEVDSKRMTNSHNSHKSDFFKRRSQSEKKTNLRKTLIKEPSSINKINVCNQNAYCEHLLTIPKIINSNEPSKPETKIKSFQRNSDIKKNPIKKSRKPGHKLQYRKIAN